MKKLLQGLLLFFTIFIWNSDCNAQLFPVQLTPVFRTPYSVKISDYATSMDTKMQLMINATDFTIMNRSVRLKLYIQGSGLNIQSSDYVTGQRPILINGGELQTLTNTDLAALFRLENLQGITALQYANGLPDGMYNFCFEMYDFVTNQRISQKSCSMMYIILNDPPLLNTPQKNEQIAASDFPNIMFTWTPRQMNATNISYNFELKQLMDPSLDPQFAFQMAPILYGQTLFGTALLYNLSMPILTPGMRYAWRVRAISTTGLSKNSVFKNNGYSEIYSFKYTQKCDPPTFALSEIESPGSAKISWQGLPDHTKYQVQYRKKEITVTNKRGKEKVKTFEWFSTYSKNNQALLTNLEPETTYEFKVGSTCTLEGDGIQSFNYSNTNTFTIPKKENSIASYNCGIKPAIRISNKTPITNLIQSETFTAGDFPVTILELEGHNPYSGKGYIIVPYLADTKIAVEFNNITINTDYQLINGVVETSYNPAGINIVDTNSIIANIESLINDIKIAIEEQTKSGVLPAEEAKELLKEVEEQNEIAQKNKEQIKETQEAIDKEKEEKKEDEIAQEQNNKLETAKAALNDAHNKLQEIANKLGVKAGKGNRESDEYFQGLLPLAANNGTLQIKQIDGNGVFTFKTTDVNFLETYSTTVSGKKYTFVITTSNSTKEELEKAKSMVDNPAEGIVIYNHYDLKNNKLGYKVNFANNFFAGIKQQDIQEIRELYAEALNNTLDGAENVTDWAGEIFKATTQINSVFQDLINKIVLPESIWNPADKDFADNKYKMEALDAGLIDGALDEIKSIPLLISIVVDYTTSKTAFDKINQAFSDFSFKEAIKSSYQERKELYTGQSIPKIEHQTGKDIVAVGTFVVTGGASAISKTKKGLNFVEELVQVVKTKGLKETGEIVKDAIQKKLDDIVTFMKTPDFAKKLDDAFNRYKGKLSKEKWEEKYKTLYKNREKGSITETKFEELMGSDATHLEIQTGNGKRYVDNVLNGVGKEIKSGKVTWSAYKDQVLKDIEIIQKELSKKIERIEWHCFDDVDPTFYTNLKKELQKAGLKESDFIIIKY